jgi:hypothetical protein
VAYNKEELEVEFIESGDKAILIKELNYTTEQEISYVVPVGFETDFATVPQLFQSIVPKIGTYTKATILHDYWYKAAINTRAWADSEFLKACLMLGTPRWKAYLMYVAVRIFGKGNY